MSQHQHTDPDWLPEDFRFTATLLRRYTGPAGPSYDEQCKLQLFQAVCSNNLNIILAALDAAATNPDFLPQP